VPTSNRDVNSRSAIFSFDGLSDIEKIYAQSCPLRMRLYARNFLLTYDVPNPSSRAKKPVRLGPRDPDEGTLELARRDPSAALGMTAFNLRNEDCVRGMQLLRGESIDLVVTSPPYNLGVRYSKFLDRADRAGYLHWCKTWATEIARLLKANGSFFLNVGATPANPMFPHQIVLELSNLFVLQNTIHWIKSIGIEEKNGKVVSHGHFKPINSRRFLNDCHEYIFHFTKSGRVEIDRLTLGVPYQDKTNISRWSHTGGRDRRCRGNTWFVPYATIQSRQKERPHPATFPVRLAEWCIKLHGVSRVDIVLDPFLGIGNSAVAAQRCGVKHFIGFEIDETYLKEAKKRLG
jgi:site-specific DNA-methyltransferase (adenine-specific)